MNQGRIWCVVNPTVGLPLFLGSVALTSLAVHTAVMTHTNWMSSYWQGAARPKTAMLNGAATPTAFEPNANPGFTMTVTPVAATSPASPASFVINVVPTPSAAPAAPALTAAPFKSAKAD